MPTPYIGRFAPSPSGPLHFGSLATAMGSYLQAHTHRGQWLLRIEDIDPPREVKGAADAIIQSLEGLGFEWRQPITWQRNNLERYREIIHQLSMQGLLFACACSRRQLINSATPGLYSGTCREKKLPFNGNSLRIRANGNITFNDAIQGRVSAALDQQTGDFIVQRRDGLFAYQLAVVVDDADQGITEVVRGADLLDNTARQIFLQRTLKTTTPNYCHLPMATDKNGNKLSKHNKAKAIGDLRPIDLLKAVWHFLGQRYCQHTFDSVEDFWHWAKANWKLDNVPRDIARPAPTIARPGRTNKVIHRQISA